jgi:dihydrofolate reductase
LGTIVSNFFISLDSVVESPDQWHFPYFNDEMGAAVGEGMETAGAFLMGRKLYEEWSDYWPKQGPEVEFSSFINNIPKYVVSTTLNEASWNNTTLLSSTDELRAVKERTDGTIQLSGSATLVRSLLADGLLDELNLLVHPIAVGHGQRLFEDTPTYPLRLTKHAVFSTGVLHLVYAPEEPKAEG